MNKQTRVERLERKEPPTLHNGGIVMLVQWNDGSYHDFDGNLLDLETIEGAVLTMSPNVARAVDHKVIVLDADDAQL